MYVFSGVGASASVSVTTGGGGSSGGGGGAPAVDCVSRLAQATAAATCRTLHIGCPTAALPVCPECQSLEEQTQHAILCRALFGAAATPHCNRANIPVCAAPEPVPGQTSASAFQAPPAKSTAPRQITGGQVSPGVTGFTGRKLPVPTSLPEATPPPPAPSGGVPTWAWIAGGVAVLGGVAYFATRKKAA